MIGVKTKCHRVISSYAFRVRPSGLFPVRINLELLEIMPRVGFEPPDSSEHTKIFHHIYDSTK
jgi:hypothetical protein